MKKKISFLTAILIAFIFISPILSALGNTDTKFASVTYTIDELTDSLNLNSGAKAFNIYMGNSDTVTFKAGYTEPSKYKLYIYRDGDAPVERSSASFTYSGSHTKIIFALYENDNEIERITADLYTDAPQVTNRDLASLIYVADGYTASLNISNEMKLSIPSSLTSIRLYAGCALDRTVNIFKSGQTPSVSNSYRDIEISDTVTEIFITANYGNIETDRVKLIVTKEDINLPSPSGLSSVIYKSGGNFETLFPNISNKDFTIYSAEKEAQSELTFIFGEQYRLFYNTGSGETEVQSGVPCVITLSESSAYTDILLTLQGLVNEHYSIRIISSGIYYPSLTDIKIGGNTIEGFSPDKYIYNINADLSVNSLDLSYTKASEHTSVTVSGNSDFGTGSTSEVTITLTELNSKTVYTIYVTKSAPSITSNKYIIDTGKKLIYGLSDSLSKDEFLSNIQKSGCTLEIRDKDGKIYNGKFIGTGLTVNVVANGKVFASYQTILYGDVNSDGKINATDIYSIILNSYFEDSKNSPSALAANTNRSSDGKINSADLYTIVLNGAGYYIKQN